jgi:predicted nuclease with TOPRIM domain
MSVGKGGSVMTVERLQKLQQDVNESKPCALDDCAALIAEIWRLKTSLTGKDMEVAYCRENCDNLNGELSRINQANDLLRAEVDELKAVHGLATCELENRWSNCAVRLKKRDLQDR